MAMDFRLALIFMPLLFLGCISQPHVQPDITDGSEDGWSKYNGFASFEFPSSMQIAHRVENYASGSGYASVSGQETGDNRAILALMYANLTMYGASQDYTADPAGSVRMFLAADGLSDPAGLMTNAKDIGEISGYAHSSGYAAEVVFSIDTIGSSGSVVRFSGYAVDIYFPEKSALYRFRVVSENASHATLIKERFLESFEG